MQHIAEGPDATAKPVPFRAPCELGSEYRIGVLVYKLGLAGCHANTVSSDPATTWRRKLGVYDIVIRTRVVFEH